MPSRAIPGRPGQLLARVQEHTIGRHSVLAAAVGALLLAACKSDGGTAPPAPNSWVQKASSPGGPVLGAVSFVVNDKLYVGTGLRNNYTNSFSEYDPGRNTWTAVASLPSDVRLNAIGFAIGNYGYVGLGSNCLGSGVCTFQYFSDLWRYDPRSNSWARMADFPGTARALAATFVIGDNAYVTGGSYAGDNDLWEYNPAANSWTRKVDYPGRCTARQTAFSVAGKGYLGLGYSDGPCDDFWRYDPSANSWTATAIFPGPARYDALGFSLGNTSFVVGGGTVLTDVWAYNPSNDSWAKLDTAYPGKGRSQMIAGIASGRIFLGLGTNSDAGAPVGDDLWEYIPAQ